MNQASSYSIASAAAAVFTALIFLRAAWHKLRDVESFAGLVADYRVVPGWVAPRVSRAIIAAEASVTIALLVPMQRIGAALAIALFLIYAAAMTANIVQSRTQLDCGCGASLQTLNWWLVARNLVCVGVATLALWPEPVGLSIGERAAAIASALTFWIGFLLVEQLLANASLIRRNVGEESS